MSGMYRVCIAYRVVRMSGMRSHRLLKTNTVLETRNLIKLFLAMPIFGIC
jgi:hypothetical protein